MYKKLSGNLKTRDLLGLFLILFVFLALPLTVIQTLNSRDDRSKADTTTTDPLLSNQWGLHKMGVPAAWDINKGSTSVVVAILDTGIDWSKEDLQGQVVDGWDFVNNDPSAFDDGGTGTHNAGIIAANTNNGKGIAGISWYSKLMPVKVCDAYSACTTGKMVEGINYAASNGASIIHIGWSMTTFDQTLQNAINAATQAGILVVARAGDSGETQFTGNPIQYPAAMSNVLAVGSTTESDTVLTSSSHGTYVDVAAPGLYIDSTSLTGYSRKTGTAKAAANAAGVAALVKSACASLTPTQITDTLKNTAVDIDAPGVDTKSGSGRINAFAAVSSARNQCGDTVAPSIVRNVRAISGADGNPGVTVMWDPATDNVAVLGYHVYRNGSTTPLNTTPEVDNSYDPVSSNPTDTYTVKAKDTSQNLSIAFSSPAATVVACNKVNVDAANKGIDLGDTLAILAHFGESPNIPANYNPTYDIDTNPGIDLADAIYSLSFFGKTCI